MYKLKLHREVAKAFRKIKKSDRTYAEKIQETIQSLAENPRPHGFKKLQNGIFRIRQGNYRIIYAIYDKIVTVVVVALRRRDSDTYKRLEKLRERAKQEVDNLD